MANRLQPTLIAAPADISRLLVLAWLSILRLAHSEGRTAPKSIHVVTTSSVFADFIANVGGERVQVTSLVPAGADPHTWEPTPREIRAVSTAVIFVYNGLGLELWAPRLIEAAGRPD